MSFNKIINVTSDSSNYGAIIQNAPICRLPVDLFFKILEQLDPATVNKVCSSICKQFNIILSSTSYDRIWSDVFCLHFPNEKINDIKNFSLAYKNKIFTLSNIKNGIYVLERISEQSGDKRIAIDAKGRLLIANSNDIEIWDLISGERTNIPLSHSRMKTLTASNERLYVGFFGGEIEILDIKTGQSLNTLKGHTSVLRLGISRENLIALYRDGGVEILNIKKIETPSIEYKRTVLQSWNSDVIASLIIQKPILQKPILQNCDSWTTTASLITSDGKYVIGCSLKKHDSSPCIILIKDLMSQENAVCLEVHGNSAILSLACDNEILYAGLSSGEIKVFDLKSLKYVATLIGDKSQLSSFSAYHSRINSLAIVDGHLYVDDYIGIVKFDFTKNHDIVFREIAEHLEQVNINSDRSKKIIQDAMQRFLRMPQSQRNRIYEELYLLLKPENHYWGWGEAAFNDQYPLSSSPLEKSKAIQNYLASLKSEKANLHSPSSSSLEKSAEMNNPVSFKNEEINLPIVYPLLQCLKIETDKDYSNQLLCRPDQLNVRGIFTLKDLLVICPPSLEIQELSIDLSVANTNPDFREVQVRANRNRLNLSDLCQQMLGAITKMAQEKKHWGMILYYDGNEYWSELQQQLNQFNDIVKKCDRNPHAIIQAFTGDVYVKLAKQLNDLIKEFHEVDRKHRIVKLRAYIHQEVILQVWTSQKLKDQGILTLSDFQEKYQCSLRELLHMKEYIEKL